MRVYYYNMRTARVCVIIRNRHGVGFVGAAKVEPINKWLLILLRSESVRPPGPSQVPATRDPLQSREQELHLETSLMLLQEYFSSLSFLFPMLGSGT